MSHDFNMANTLTPCRELLQHVSPGRTFAGKDSYDSCIFAGKDVVIVRRRFIPILNCCKIWRTVLVAHVNDGDIKRVKPATAATAAATCIAQGLYELGVQLRELFGDLLIVGAHCGRRERYCK